MFVLIFVEYKSSRIHIGRAISKTWPKQNNPQVLTDFLIQFDFLMLLWFSHSFVHFAQKARLGMLKNRQLDHEIAFAHSSHLIETFLAKRTHIPATLLSKNGSLRLRVVSKIKDAVDICFKSRKVMLQNAMLEGEHHSNKSLMEIISAVEESVGLVCGSIWDLLHRELGSHTHHMNYFFFFTFKTWMYFRRPLDTIYLVVFKFLGALIRAPNWAMETSDKLTIFSRIIGKIKRTFFYLKLGKYIFNSFI